MEETMSDQFSEKRQQREIRLDAQKTALLVVDMLNDFFEENGVMVLEGGKVLYDPIRRLIETARHAQIPVFWLNQTLYPGDRLFEKRIVHCIEGTWGAQVVDALPVMPNDIIIAKRRYSGFFQTDLDLHLRERRIEQVIVVGVVTNICVRSTVNDAFFLGYDVFVPEDGVAATSERQQEAHLYDIDTHYGTVTSVDTVINQIRGALSLASRG
jgi:ureidoacrylate peracid hydrolase